MIDKKLLIVSECFYPEEFKINDIAISWIEKGFDIDVITLIPTYPFGKVYDGYNSDWKETYRKQVAAVKEYIGIRRGYDYSRDSGTMPFIENIAKTDCGVSVKDRWNPMDIIMVNMDLTEVN